MIEDGPGACDDDRMRLAPVLLAAALLAACSSPDTSTLDAGPADAGAEDAAVADAAAAEDAGDAAPDAAPCTLASPYSTQDAVCNACAEAKCCAAINGCLLLPACNDDYVNCALGCSLDPGDAGVDPCLADCAAQSPEGKAAYDAAIGCADAACAVECQ